MVFSNKRWIENEFLTASFGDARLKTRFNKLMLSFSKNGQDNISKTFCHWSEMKACYRFISNSKVTTNKILTPHSKETVIRAKKFETVLLLQDTTFIPYSNREKAIDFDILNSKKTGTRIKGLMLHNSLAISETGIPLVIFNQEFIVRKEVKPRGNCYRPLHYAKTYIEKESYRWMNTVNLSLTEDWGNTQVVHITDREGDVYEFYQDCNILNQSFIVRTSQNRNIKTGESNKSTWKLFDYLESQKAIKK